MEDFFTIGNRLKSPSLKSIKISNIEDIDEEFADESKLVKLEEVDIENDIRYLVCESKNLYLDYEDINQDMINFSIVNLSFNMIDCRTIYNNDTKYLYCKEDNLFINRKIEQGVDIKYVDNINDADLVFFERDIEDMRNESNLLLYLNIKEEIDFLIDISKNFSYISIYLPERQIDDDNRNIYIYLEKYTKNKHDTDIRGFLTNHYNKLISKKEEFYIKCIKVKANKQYSINENSFNFISCEKVLNLY